MLICGTWSAPVCVRNLVFSAAFSFLPTNLRYGFPKPSAAPAGPSVSIQHCSTLVFMQLCSDSSWVKSARAANNPGVCCLCLQAWQQRACIASVGTRRTWTTSRNSLIKVRRRYMLTAEPHEHSFLHVCFQVKPFSLLSQPVVLNNFPMNFNHTI